MNMKFITIATLASLTLLLNCTKSGPQQSATKSSLTKTVVAKATKTKKAKASQRSASLAEVGDDDLLETEFSCRQENSSFCFSMVGDEDDLGELSDRCDEIDDLEEADVDVGNICEDGDLIERCMLSGDDEVSVFTRIELSQEEEEMLKKLCGEGLEL